MKEYFLDIIKNHYCDFEGRARRKEYWMFVLWFMIIYMAWYFLELGLLFATESSAIVIAFSIVLWLFALALFLPSLGLAVRRLHDIGKSGWYYLFGFIPFVGWIILLVWFCTEGTIGPNEYGPDPKAAERGGTVA